MQRRERSAPDPRALGWTLIMLAAGLVAGAAAGAMALLAGPLSAVLLALLLIPLGLAPADTDLLSQTYSTLTLVVLALSIAGGALVASPWVGALAGGLFPAALLLTILGQ